MAETSESLFKKAYDAHYKERNFEKASAGYNAVIEQFPDSPEASYARQQLEHLARSRDDLGKQRITWDYNQLIEPEVKAEPPEPTVMLTTAPWLEGYQITETLEVVTAECVFGMNVLRDFFASVTDFVGGRSESTQTILRDARKVCLTELKREANRVGANAVIAVDLDYSEFTGQGKSMLFLVASGTAVKVEKKEPTITPA